MKTLFEKPSARDTWPFFLSKFGTLFNKVTGYDYMFEASRADIQTNNHGNEGSIGKKPDDTPTIFSWSK